MEVPITPFWFKQRQCKAEPHGDGRTLRVTGPNLAEAYLHVRDEGVAWVAGLRLAPEGQDVATAAVEPASENAAWNTAFELYRQHVIA
jgi:hypothetical protein